MEAFGVIVGNFDFCSEWFNFWFRPYSCWLENSHKEWSERYYSLALSRLPLLIFPEYTWTGPSEKVCVFGSV